MKSNDVKAPNQFVLSTIVSVDFVIAGVTEASVDLGQEADLKIGKVGEVAVEQSPASVADIDRWLALEFDPSGSRSLNEHRLDVTSRRSLQTSAGKNRSKHNGARLPTVFGPGLQFGEEVLVPEIGPTTVVASKSVFHGEFQSVGIDEPSEVSQRSCE